MKLLELRHSVADIILMTWSPKMDLVAIVTAKHELVLHRLTWQKVWSLGSTNPAKKDSPVAAAATNETELKFPVALTFHPEGLYLALGLEHSVLIIEVETGKIKNTREVNDLSVIRWKPTIFQTSFKDVISSNAERTESNLSILLIGTKVGLIHIYSGASLLFTVTLTVNLEQSCRILDIEIPPDFSFVQALADTTLESDKLPNIKVGDMLTFHHFEAFEYNAHGDVLGVFAAKAICYRTYISAIEAELTGIQENWGKIYTVYMHYLTYGTGHLSETIKADYCELLMTAVSNIETEMFLGSVGREKETKKFITGLQGAITSLNENFRAIKHHIVSFLKEISEITGFHLYVQKNVQLPSAATKVINTLRKLMSLLYYGCLVAQHTATSFLRCFYHFLTLLVNTIHNYHIFDNPELLEEQPDPDRVFELFRFRMKKNLFEMLQLNPHDHATNPKSKTRVPNRMRTSENLNPNDPLAFLNEELEPLTPEDLKKFYDTRSIIDISQIEASVLDLSEPIPPKDWMSFRQFLKDKGITVDTNYFHMQNDKLSQMIVNFPNLAEEQISDLLEIPLLRDDIPVHNYVLNAFEDSKDLYKDVFRMEFDIKTKATSICQRERSSPEGGVNVTNRFWLHRICNFGYPSEPDPSLTSALFKVSQVVKDIEFLNSHTLTILSHAANSNEVPQAIRNSENTENEPSSSTGQCILSCMNVISVMEKLPSRFLFIPEGTTELENKWATVDLTIPLDKDLVGPIEHEHLSHILSIGTLQPYMMALGGARRVGAIVDITKKGVQLLDMDLEAVENSMDVDTTIDSNASTVIEDVRDMTLD